ncbi:hypothetical protein M0802_005498 [Mischocyttarus mexicanus]|nr:hypothetical protein M0802_005498 [Mischocyttarus mexicanus]
MDSENIDIYEDLPSYEIKSDEDLKTNENISCEELKEEVSKLKLQLEEVQKIKETLEVNLSSLLKTAKAEISRKDRMIAELRNQIDDMIFRRIHCNKNVKDDKKSMKQLPEKNLHEYSHTKTYTENESNLMPKQPSFNSNNDKYNPVASNSSETDFQHSVSDNCNYSNEDQTENNKYYNNQFNNKRYQCKKLPVSHTASTTVYTERFRKKIMAEEEAEKKQKLLLEEKNEQNTNGYIDNKENHSYSSILNSNIDDTISESKEVVCNFVDNSNNTEGYSNCLTNQQRVILSNKDSKKRSNNLDTTLTQTSKRQKLDIEHNMCTDKTNISKVDVNNGFDNEMASTKNNKLNNEESSNYNTEKNVSSNSKYDKDSKSHSKSYRREKDYYTKSNSDYKYNFKNSTERYREKDKYDHKRNRSPVSKYSDRKYRPYDDRYNRDYRDKYKTDKRRNSQDKEDNISITSDKSYKDRNRYKEKYVSMDFHSSKNTGRKYSNLYDIKSSVKSNPNNITDDIKLISEKNVKVKTHESSIKINLDQCTDKLKSSNIVDKHTCLTRKDNENLGDKENNHQIQKVEVNIVAAITVNSCSKETNIPLVENNVVTSASTVTFLKDIDNDVKKIIIDENKSKCDKIVSLKNKAEESKSICDNIQNLSEDTLRNNTKISLETKQENNIVCKYNDEKEDKSFLNNSKVNVNMDDIVSVDKPQKENDNDQQESLEKVNEKTVATVTDLQENKKHNNDNKHVKVTAIKSNKKEISKCDDSEVIIFARRRRNVNLTDNNASMTIVIDSKNINIDILEKDDIENDLKQRACKVSRSYKDIS